MLFMGVALLFTLITIASQYQPEFVGSTSQAPPFAGPRIAGRSPYVSQRHIHSSGPNR